MTTYNSKYILDNRSGKKKLRCPSCGHSKTLTLYIDSETQDYLDEAVGICDRINNCNYHFKPKDYFIANPSKLSMRNSIVPFKNCPVEKPTSFIDHLSLSESMEMPKSKNHFCNYLIKIFSVEYADILFERYRIGSSDKWPGACVFWQIDIEQKIRTGKIMLYNPFNGKRIKEPFSHIAWMHKEIKQEKEFHLKQCLFGEHILKYEPGIPVAIVESEKTAVICYALFPEYIWLATGSAQGLNTEKCKVLKGRKVILFPDLGEGYRIWSEKVKSIRAELSLNIWVSDLIEKRTEEEVDKTKGFDLVDFILRK